MHPWVKSFFAALAAVCACAPVHASDPSPEMYNARAMALGGAVTSVPGKIMSARANPAALAPIKGFYGGATYLTRNENQLDGIAVTLIDNVSAPITGALNYERTVTDGESEEVALSLASGMNGYYWGVSGRFAHTRKTRLADWDNTFLGDAGLLIMRDSGFSFGLAARDFFDSNYQALKRRVAGGLSYSLDSGLLLSADYVRYFDLDEKRGATIHTGIEWKPNQTPWSFRVGGLFDRITRETYFSLGAGWSNQAFEIDYAYRANRDHGADDIHILTLSYPF